MEEQTKYCKFCKNTKSIKEFSTHSNCLYGVQNKCKKCVNEYRLVYNKQNKEKILKYNVNFNKTYNPKWNDKNMHIQKWRSIVSTVLKYKDELKTNKTYCFLKFTPSEFKTHIESQFKENMNWGNIHIDHKIPLSWFEKHTPIYIINNLSNLQPLLSFDNTSKSNKYSHPVDIEYFDLCKIFIKEKYISLVPKCINSLV
jgi:hypothetical protein